MKGPLGNHFVRNVVTLAGGSAVSQAISLGSAPLIARLYGPEAYGILGMFISVAGLLVTIGSLSFHLAIVLPASHCEAVALTRLSILLSVFTSTSLLLVLVGGIDYIPIFLIPSILKPYFWLIPLVMFVALCNATFTQWLIRNELFLALAKLGVYQSAAAALLKVFGGWLAPQSIVLITLHVAAVVISGFLLLWTLQRHGCFERRKSDNARDISLRAVALRYQDFPLFRSPQALINAASLSLPIFMLAAYSGPVSVGNYVIVMSVLSVPLALISNSFGQVFYPRVATVVNSGAASATLLVRSTFWLAIVALFPFITLMLFSPVLFGLLFGPEWESAGIYARWLSPMLFFQFINKPAVTAIPVLNLQGGLLLYECIAAFSRFLAVFVGFRMFGSDVSAIVLFSFTSSLLYIVLIVWVVIRSLSPSLRMPH